MAGARGVSLGRAGCRASWCQAGETCKPTRVTMTPSHQSSAMATLRASLESGRAGGGRYVVGVYRETVSRANLDTCHYSRRMDVY